MADTADTIKTAYPLPAYNYVVSLDGVDMSFSEVSGLSQSYETITYKENALSGTGPVTLNMPGQPSSPNITLKKGIISGSESFNEFFTWAQSIRLNTVDKRDIDVRLCDEEGTPVVSWKVLNAFPKKVDAPSFSATSNEAAIESLELMADEVILAE